jgi:hypothetical protein
VDLLPRSINIERNLVVADPVPGGFTWTLTSRLGQLLHLAESQFGPRDRSFAILGAEFREGGPQTWFPGDRRHVAIQLGMNTLTQPFRAFFQLAHETVHLLDPHPYGTNNLEEGIATRFQVDFMKSEFDLDYPIGDPKYEKACDLVTNMLTLRCNSAKELRLLYGPWRSISADQISAVCPGIDSSIAEELAKPFPT